MRSIFKIVPVLAAAVFLASMAPGSASAGGYGHSGHGSYYYGYKSHHGHHGHYHHGYRPRPVYVVPRPVYVTPPPVYVRPQPVYEEDYRWRRQPPEVVTTWNKPAERIDYNPPSAGGPAATCVMTREYQTQLTVGGQLVPGYGTACLQPDGSWYRGPAVPITNR